MTTLAHIPGKGIVVDTRTTMMKGDNITADGTSEKFVRFPRGAVIIEGVDVLGVTVAGDYLAMGNLRAWVEENFSRGLTINLDNFVHETMYANVSENMTSWLGCADGTWRTLRLEEHKTVLDTGLQGPLKRLMSMKMEKFHIGGSGSSTLGDKFGNCIGIADTDLSMALTSYAMHHDEYSNTDAQLLTITNGKLSARKIDMSFTEKHKKAIRTYFGL